MIVHASGLGFWDQLRFWGEQGRRLMHEEQWNRVLNDEPVERVM
jgi:hypothetical protein